jgi:hypothetical protein
MIRRPLIALATASSLAILATSCKPANDAPAAPEATETPEAPAYTAPQEEPTPSDQTPPAEPAPAEPAPAEPAPAEPAAPTGASATSDDPLIQQGTKLLDETVIQITAICTALENITDEASATAASSAIADASVHLKQLSTDGKALSETLSDEQNAEMEEIANEKMGGLMARMGDAIESIVLNPDAAPALEALEAFNRAMSGAE